MRAFVRDPQVVVEVDHVIFLFDGRFQKGDGVLILPGTNSDESEIVEGVGMLWHIYRAEDVGLNRLVTDGVEVFDQGSWAGRLDVQTRYAGTGMTAEEVSALSSRIRIDDLKSYGQAVHKRTVEIVNALTGSELSEVPDNAHIDRVMCQEEVLPECAWNYLPLYYGKTKGWFLMHLGLTHSYYHIGQISLAKKLLL